MTYWHKIDREIKDGLFDVSISYEYSNDYNLEDMYPEDTKEQLYKMYKEIDKDEAYVFNIKIEYSYHGYSLAAKYLHNNHYSEYPSDVIESHIDCDLKEFMLDTKEDALEKARILLCNLRNDFGSTL